jgi:hypothetical protein
MGAVEDIKEGTALRTWCAFFFRIHLLALETVTISAYYAWFGYFDMILGSDGHADDVAYFNDKAGTNLSGTVHPSRFSVHPCNYLPKQ